MRAARAQDGGAAQQRDRCDDDRERFTPRLTRLRSLLAVTLSPILMRWLRRTQSHGVIGVAERITTRVYAVVIIAVTRVCYAVVIAYAR